MTMSGNKQMVINTRERAVSSDINRLQSFGGWQAAEEARRLLMSPMSDETADGGVETLETAITTPLTALFVGGGLVKPVPASTSLLIDPSVCWVVYPDTIPNIDDSPAKLVIDPGVTVAGTLVLTPGHATLFRVDVVECQPILQVIETSNRDIFNPATGLFGAAVVNKVQVLRWSYRIRTGTAGAGMPANQLGWLPLMVAVVPALAATWDAVPILYDVRPLAADHVRQPFKVTRLQPKNLRMEIITGYQYEAAAIGAGTQKFINGVAEWAYNGKIAGGALPNGGLDLSTNDFASAGFLAGLGANVQWSFYAAFPFSLPRWAKYTAVSGVTQRVPMSFRGIPCASLTNPVNFTRIPTVAITLPTNTQLGGAGTTDAICLWTGYSGSAASLQQASADGEWVSVPPGSNTMHSPVVTNLGGGALGPSGGAILEFSLRENVEVPIGAKAVRLRLQVSSTIGGAGLVAVTQGFRVQIINQAYAVQTFDATSSSTVLDGFGHVVGVYTIAAAAGLTMAVDVEIPLPPSYPGLTSPWALKTWRLAMITSPANANNAFATATGTARVIGFKL